MYALAWFEMLRRFSVSEDAFNNCCSIFVLGKVKLGGERSAWERKGCWLRLRLVINLLISQNYCEPGSNLIPPRYLLIQHPSTPPHEPHPMPSLPYELLVMICSYLANSDLKNARLASPTLSEICEKFLYRHMVLKPNMESFRHLDLVSKHPRYRHYVESLDCCGHPLFYNVSEKVAAAAVAYKP